MKKRFMIGTLAAAGIIAKPAMSAELVIIGADAEKDGEGTFFNRVHKTHTFTLAAHRSHSSHGSHQSHRSSTPRPPSPDSSRAGTARTQPRVTVTAPSIPAQRIVPNKIKSTTKNTFQESTPEAIPVLPAASMVAPKDERPKLNSSDSSPPTSILPETSLSILKPKTLPGNSNKFREIARKVQAGLSIYGYYSDAIDGLIGPKSKLSISRFQKDFGLLITGTISEELLDSLGIVAE